MDFKDISSRMKQAKQKQQPEAAEAKPFDYEESYRLRGKMTGVLIRDARVQAARTIEDCARLLNVTPQTVEAWEFGEDVPDLPQLELLAFYLDVPVSHFWGQKTYDSDPTKKANMQSEYMSLRHRMIGALLRQAREEESLSLDDVAERSQIPLETLSAYEMGQQSIPMNHLSVLSSIVNKNIDYFLETGSYIGELLKIREEWKRFTDLDEEIREFAANPTNVNFIKIGMLYRDTPTELLRKIAEGLLDITM